MGIAIKKKLNPIIYVAITYCNYVNIFRINGKLIRIVFSKNSGMWSAAIYNNENTFITGGSVGILEIWSAITGEKNSHFKEE